METLENLDQKEELLTDLEQAKEIIKRNIQANSKLDLLLKELTKTNTDVWFTLLGVIVGFFALVVSALSLLKLKNFELTFMLIPLVLIILSIIIFKKLGKNKEKSIIQKRFEERKYEIDEITAAILKTYEESEKISVLPEKYKNIHSIEIIQEYLINMRADSLKEALNLYEDEMMKLQQMQLLNRISQKQNDLIQAQQATTRGLAWQTFLLNGKK